MRMVLLDHESSLLLMRRKGSNPEHKRRPTVKCPLCKKILYTVANATVRNCVLAYDVRDPRYASYPVEYYMRCSRCHNVIGITYLNTELRKKLGLPLLHEKTNPMKNN